LVINHSVRVAIVAGEMSGDLLGGALMRELKKHLSHVQFIGIGGSQMLHEGLDSCVEIERMSVMGVSDVLKRYPELYRIRQKLFNEWTDNPPDVFIGIDYSKFNLSLALRLKKKGIKTVQFVSPKIWAWRQKRVFYIKKAIDLILTLFPFEEAFYQHYDVPVQFVGHPLADLIDLNVDTHQMKKKSGYKADDKVVAVLPGSRISEMKYMGPLFLDVMYEISLSEPQVHFIVPIAKPSMRQIFETQLQTKAYNLNLQITDGRAREAMGGADVVLAKSGTSTLEAMLLKRPMVVAFKWGALTHAIIAPQVKVPFISLPNLLASQELVPEFVQSKALPKPIAQAVLEFLHSPNVHLKPKFLDIHQRLKQDASAKAAAAILKILNRSAV
jgi:lipid-A-disaccharide synthase